MEFEFATAGRILFGPGRVKEMVPAAQSFGRRVFFVAGRSGRRAAPWIERLREAGLYVQEFHASGEPTVEIVQQGLDQSRSAGCDLVISMGGGSVIDAGKAIATLLTNPGTAYDYLEVVGEGKAFVNAAMPFIAVPTTAGTGSEVTRNAVLGVTEKQVKVSLRGPQMLAKLAIVDPELTYELPPSVTASSGMDALTQLIEPFLSAGANPVTDAICRDGIERVRRSLKDAYTSGENREARQDMSLASLFSGMVLANAKLGGVHGFAGPIGGMCAAAHGAICARLLPVVMQVNLRALRERDPDALVLGRFRELAGILTGNPEASAEAGTDWLYQLRDALRIPALSEYGLKPDAIPEVVARAKRANSMKGNPIALNESELFEIVQSAL